MPFLKQLRRGIHNTSTVILLLLALEVALGTQLLEADLYDTALQQVLAVHALLLDFSHLLGLQMLQRRLLVRGLAI